MNRVRGQALVEFSIMVGVFAALGVGMQVLGGWQRLQRQAVMAAHEVAFSATWSNQPVEPQRLQEHTLALHFDGVGTAAPGSGEPLLQRGSGMSLTLSQAPPPGSTPALLSTLMRPLRVVGGFLGGEFDLQQQGFAQAEVSLQGGDLPGLPEPWSSAGLQARERAAVLGDSWAAANPQHVASRTAGLVPTSVLARQSAWLRPLLWPARLIEPALGRLCLGLIEPERLPIDRLLGATPNAEQPGDVSCH